MYIVISAVLSLRLYRHSIYAAHSFDSAVYIRIVYMYIPAAVESSSQFDITRKSHLPWNRLLSLCSPPSDNWPKHVFSAYMAPRLRILSFCRLLSIFLQTTRMSPTRWHETMQTSRYVETCLTFHKVVIPYAKHFRYAGIFTDDFFLQICCWFYTANASSKTDSILRICGIRNASLYNAWAIKIVPLYFSL